MDEYWVKPERDWFSFKSKYFSPVPVNNLFKWEANINGINYTVWATGLGSWSTLELSWQNQSRHFHNFSDVERFIDEYVCRYEGSIYD